MIARLDNAAAARDTLLPEGQVASGSQRLDDDHGSCPSTTNSSSAHRSQSQSQFSNNDARRQRRRLDEPRGHDGIRHSPSSASSRSPVREEESLEDSEESGEDEIAIAVGQLSLNEDEQVRFHGKMSGLHLLGVKALKDGQNEGGIW